MAVCVERGALESLISELTQTIQTERIMILFGDCMHERTSVESCYFCTTWRCASELGSHKTHRNSHENLVVFTVMRVGGTVGYKAFERNNIPVD